MPYCTNCGEEVTDEQRYCSYCGEPVGDDHRGRRGRRDRPDRNESAAAGTEQTEPGSGRGTEPEVHRTEESQQSSAVGGDPPPEGYEDPESLRPDRSEDTFSLFGGSFKRVLRLPVLLAVLFVAWVVFFLADFAPATLQFPGTIVAGLIGLYGAGLLYVAAERSRNDEELTLADAATQVSGQFLTLVGVWLVFTPLFLIGLSLLVLPGLYIGGRLLLAFPACVLDREGVVESLSTSWELTSDVSLRTFGLLALGLLVSIILAILSAIVLVTVLLGLGVDLPDAAAESPGEVAEVAEDLDSDLRFVIPATLLQAITLAVPVAAVQFAAGKLYLDRRYGGPGEERP